MLILFNSNHKNADANAKIVLYQELELNELNGGNKIRMNEEELHSIESVNLNQQSIVIILAYIAQRAKFFMIISLPTVRGNVNFR